MSARSVVARVIAVLAASGLVVGALAIRGTFDESRPGDASDAPFDRVIRLSCVRALDDVCRGLAGLESDLRVAVESAGNTATRLTSSQSLEAAGTDAWLTLTPWDQIVREARSRAGLAELVRRADPALARSPLAIAIWTDRLDALVKACSPVTWSCIGNVAPGTWADIGGDVAWGLIKPGHARADEDAVGLLVAGQAAAQRIGRPDFSTFDLADDGFRAWFAGLERAIPSFSPPAGSHLTEMLQFGPSKFDLAGLVEAEAAALLARAPERAEDLVIFYPQPLVTADVVLVPIGPEEAIQWLRALLNSDAAIDLFAGAGWRIRDRVPDLPASIDLPTSSGVSPAGSLDALRTAWREAIR